jgi:ferredoxin-NADP reductase
VIERELIVTARTPIADRVLALELAAADGTPLPAWEPGAHIDLRVADDIERQYSLCGDPSGERWTVAVLREDAGRGGSRTVHEKVQVGDRLRARMPRNHFVFSASSPALFIAGGIGITPLVPMINAAQDAGVPWRLVYAGRRRSGMAFLEQLAVSHGERVSVHVSEEGSRLDLSELLAKPTGESVWCCGPEGMLAEVERLMATWPPGSLHVERFVAAPAGAADADAAVDPERAFEVEIDGTVLNVPPDRSILEVAEEAGLLVLSSCREGTCGTCELRIAEGEADHRDSVLSAEEQAAGHSMMICVSRAKTARLVLET